MLLNVNFGHPKWPPGEGMVGGDDNTTSLYSSVVKNNFEIIYIRDTNQRRVILTIVLLIHFDSIQQKYMAYFVSYFVSGNVFVSSYD